MITDLKAIAPLILTKSKKLKLKPSKRKSKKMKSNTYEECLMELAAHIKFDPKDQDCIAQDDSQGY